MINDRHMAVGDWSIDLLPDTPQHVRDWFRSPSSFVWGTYVLFFEHDVTGYDGDQLSSTVKEELAEAAIWTGPVWRRGNKMRRFGGPSMMGYLGNTRGSAYLNSFGSPSPTWPAHISQVISSWFGSGNNGIRMGGAASPNLADIEDVAYGTYLPPVKGPLDTLMQQTGNEYWIRPTGDLDWGTAANLFRSNEVLCMEEATAGAVDFTVLRVPRDGIQFTEDIDGYRNVAKVISEDYDLTAGVGSGGAVDASFSIVLETWTNNSIGFFCGPIIRADTNDFNDVAQLAQVASELYDRPNRQIRVAVNDGCILANVVRPGDWVYVYSPLDGIVDTSNQVTVGGETIHPESLRVVAVRQPFTPGMGAYVVTYDNAGVSTYEWNIHRVTDWIVPENGTATLEVGDPPDVYVPERFRSKLR